MGVSSTVAGTASTIATAGAYTVGAGILATTASDAGEIISDGHNVIRDDWIAPFTGHESSGEFYENIKLTLTLSSLGFIELAANNPHLKPVSKAKKVNAPVSSEPQQKPHPDLNFQTENKLNPKTLFKLDTQFFAKKELNVKEIYRAVSPEEFDDIFSLNGFRPKVNGQSFKAKEFGNSFDETLKFANARINTDKAAIVKVTIPEELYNKLNHMNLDSAIFKSGTPVVEPEMLEEFNNNIINIEHVF